MLRILPQMLPTGIEGQWDLKQCFLMDKHRAHRKLKLAPLLNSPETPMFLLHSARRDAQYQEGNPV